MRIELWSKLIYHRDRHVKFSIFSTTQNIDLLFIKWNDRLLSFFKFKTIAHDANCQRVKNICWLAFFTQIYCFGIDKCIHTSQYYMCFVNRHRDYALVIVDCVRSIHRSNCLTEAVRVHRQHTIKPALAVYAHIQPRSVLVATRCGRRAYVYMYTCVQCDMREWLMCPIVRRGM